ncbi:MAG: kinase [Desulfovibrio sp.]|jgi:D-glycero-alpha-D-manno-heptose-7-phosphate kinase|nr:kinase [Desulfovibrio sp.]
MIISRTPFRVSFFGGGTDYPAWVEKHGGAVLSTSIDKYCYVSCRHLPPFFEHNYRITYSCLEHVKTVDEIQHPAIREVLKVYQDGKGLEIHCDADLPARSGLGSSSSFVVGLLHSLEGLRGRRVTPKWLAGESIRYEQQVLGETVGYQDQIAAAYGGLNILHFKKDGNFTVEPLILSAERKKEFGSHLMLFFTGFSRIASEVAKSKVANFSAREQQLHAMRAMVDEAVELLVSGRALTAFGELLHQAWQHKRSLSDGVSTAAIDEIYETARANGAIGGKLLGAGGGGFLLLFVQPGKQDAVRSALNHLIHVPFRFESGGSQVVYYRG